MKRLLSSLILFLLAGSAFAAFTAPRSIKDIPTADESLRRAVSPKFYKSLEISPVKGWVVARGQLVGTRLMGSRIVRSDMGGAYDALALELAENVHIVGNAGVGTQGSPRNVNVHLLLYDIADGRLAISFANFDESGGGQWRYYGGAWMAVQKSDDTWVTMDPVSVGRYEQRGPRTYTVGALQAGTRRVSLQPDVSWHRRFAR